METRICTKCGVEKNLLENFSIKKNGRDTRCKDCLSLYKKKHYKKNKNYYKAKAIISNAKGRARNLQYTIDYLKGHPCVDCGEKDPIVLEFDHIKDKIMSISKICGAALSLDMLKIEIKKCEVRCANCHRRKTAQQCNWYKSVTI